MILPHTVDHGEMTHGTIHIGEGAIVSQSVNMQPGSSLGAGASLDCLTLAMKNEQIPAHTAWAGTPASRVSEDVFQVRREWEVEEGVGGLRRRRRASSATSNPVFGRQGVAPAEPFDAERPWSLQLASISEPESELVDSQD